MFSNRTEAGRLLAARLLKLGLPDPVVIALPRGGVPVAAEVADALGAPLDVLIVRKMAAPGNPELAAAAIADGNPPDIVLNHEVFAAFHLNGADIERIAVAEYAEIKRRRSTYCANRKTAAVEQKTVILVDDGAATGTTIKAAIRALRRRSPARIFVAIPVAPADTAAELASNADQFLCLSQPPHFLALGSHYASFPQVPDEEVVRLLHEHPA